MDATLLGKLQKITRLIDRAGTPGEAEAAAAALNRLLLKHNLDEADVRKAKGDPESPGIIIERISVGGASKAYMWRWYLLGVIAKANLTEVVRDGATAVDGWVIGTKQNVAAVMDLFRHLATVFDRLAKEAWEAQSPADRLYVRRNVYINAFLLGVPSGLRDKFRAERRALEQEDGRLSALVVVHDKAIQDVVQAEIGRTRQDARRRRVADHQAYQDGYRAGRNYREDKSITGEHRLALS